MITLQIFEPSPSAAASFLATLQGVPNRERYSFRSGLWSLLTQGFGANHQYALAVFNKVKRTAFDTSKNLARIRPQHLGSLARSNHQNLGTAAFAPGEEPALATTNGRSLV